MKTALISITHDLAIAVFFEFYGYSAIPRR
jgi:hypothetical protein